MSNTHTHPDWIWSSTKGPRNGVPQVWGLDMGRGEDDNIYAGLLPSSGKTQAEIANVGNSFLTGTIHIYINTKTF